MELVGWVGTALVIIAYFPQIHHLWVERCAWGVSLSTWTIWLAASVILLVYASLQADKLFVVVQLINILAIVATIILVRRSNNICPYHLRKSQEVC